MAAQTQKTDLETTPHLLMLRMELKAIRDRAMADFDAAISSLDAAIPEEELPLRSASMRKWTQARWREFLDTGR